MLNFYKYMNTKPFRFCVSLLKNKQNVSKTVLTLIPHIDFLKLEKIDDENIYQYLKKYHNFTDENIQTIEDRCEKLKLLKK